MHVLFGQVRAFFHITRATIIYSVHEHDLESPLLWDVDRGDSHISLVIFPGSFDYIIPMATKCSVQSVSGECQN